MTYYDDIAEGYEELHGSEQFRKYELIRSHLTINSDNKVLDVGCGPGWGAKFFECNFTGIDPSKKLLDYGLTEGLNLHLGIAEALPFLDNEFDYVISVTAIQNFNDYVKGLQEISRVAKKAIIISVLMASEKCEDIEMAIRSQFIVVDCIHDSHDVFFFCHKQ